MATVELNVNTDTVTFLHSLIRATKLFRRSDDGDPVVEGCDIGTYFAVAERPVGDFDSLAKLLQAASQHPQWFVIRGEPREGIDRSCCRRLLHPCSRTGDPPTFRDVPRRWCVLDFDDVAAPEGLDVCNGPAVAAHCRSLLPQPWRLASTWWALSSSAGIKPGCCIKLAFWLTEPWLGSDLKRHLKGAPVDFATLEAVQPIYIAAPIFKGLDDPVACRSGVLEGSQDAVSLSPLPPMPKTKTRFNGHPDASKRYVSGLSATRARIKLSRLTDALGRAQPGNRHRCLIWAAMRAVEYDDALSRDEIAEELIAAARTSGMEDDDRELMRQIRYAFERAVALPVGDRS